MSSSYAARPSYGGGKIPDRSVSGATALPFAASALGRRPTGDFGDMSTIGASGKAGGQPNGQAGGGHRDSQGPNPLNDLTEEQREEINEAVCGYSVHLLVFHLAGRPFWVTDTPCT